MINIFSKNRISNLAFLLLIIFLSLTLNCFAEQFWKRNLSSNSKVTCIASAGDNTYIGTLVDGVFLSTDIGENWVSLSDGVVSSTVNCIIAEGDYVFAGTDNGLIFSTNKGLSWTRKDFETASSIKNVCALIICNGCIYAATKQRVFMSNDYGNSWIASTIEWGGSAIDNVKSFVRVGNSLIAYSVSSQTTNNERLCQTIIGSNYWTLGTGTKYNYKSMTSIDDNWYALKTDGSLFKQHNSSWEQINYKINFNAVDALCCTEKVVYAATVSGLYVSDDLGDTWYLLNTTMLSNLQVLMVNGSSMFGIVENPINSTKTFTAPGEGLMVSTNSGSNWRLVGNGLLYPYITSITSVDNKLYAGTANNGIFISSDDCFSWQQLSLPFDTASINELFYFGTTIYACTKNYGLLKSIDNAESWTQLNLGLSGNNVKCLAQSDHFLFLGSESGLYKSAEAGSSWTHIDIGAVNNDIRSIVISGSIIFVGTADRVYVSRDEGNTWEMIRHQLLINSYSNDPGRRITLLNGKVFVTKNTTVCVSNDLGYNWYSSYTGLPSGKIKDIKAFGSNLYAISIADGATKDFGIYYSTNEGQNWLPFNSGFSKWNDNCMISCIATSHNNIYCSNYSGVYQQYGNYSQDIDLKAGFSLISFNVDLDNAPISSVFDENSNLVLMKSSSDKFYSPFFEIYQFESFDLGKPYWVYMVAPQRITIIGKKINPSHLSTQLLRGWNYIPYLRSSPDNAFHALSSIQGKYLIIKNDTGEFFNPQTTENTLEQGTVNAEKLVPGKGYIIYMIEPATLIYQE